MIILDTSVWIEFFRARDPFIQHVSQALGLGEVMTLPWIFGELLQGARGEREVKFLLRFWRALPKPELALCDRAWIDAGKESQKGRWLSRGVGLIDAAIVCAAREMNCRVWTLDKRLGEILRSKGLLLKPHQ